MRKWGAENRENVREANRRSYERNKAKRNADSKAWYEANKDLALEQSKARYERNKTDPDWRAKKAEYQRAYRTAKRELVNEKRRGYLARNKDKQRQWAKNTRARHGDKMNERSRAWHDKNPGYVRKRYATDEQYRIANIISARFRVALRGNRKSGRAVELLGCTIEEFRRYMETKWQPGMTWENHRRYGWHIDHIRPLNSFDLSDPAQQAAACHYTNLQPMWWRENISKRDRWEGAP